MIRTSTLLALAAASALLTPVVVQATGTAPKTSAAAAIEAAAPAAESALTPCARPVRVIYAGYGDACKAG